MIPNILKRKNIRSFYVRSLCVIKYVISLDEKEMFLSKKRHYYLFKQRFVNFYVGIRITM